MACRRFRSRCFPQGATTDFRRIRSLQLLTENLSFRRSIAHEAGFSTDPPLISKSSKWISADQPRVWGVTFARPVRFTRARLRGYQGQTFSKLAQDLSTGISVLASRSTGVYTRHPSGWTGEARFCPGCRWPPRHHQFWPSRSRGAVRTASSRGHFSDTSPSGASFLTDFFSLHNSGYPAGTGSAQIRRSIAPKTRRVRCPSANSSQ